MFPLEPPYGAVPVGNVMVTLKHNAPTGVVGPGQKLRRLPGRGLPMTWKPSGIYVSTEDMPHEVGVVDVRGADEFPFPAVTVQLTLRVNARDNYQHLLDYIATKGINFAALLEGEINAEMTSRIRTAFLPRRVTEVWKEEDPLSLVGGRADLLDGLFEIVKVLAVTPTFHPEFQRIIDGKATTTREIEDDLNALSRVPYAKQLQQAEDELAAQKAGARGLSLYDYENQELLAAREEREFQAQMAREQLASAERIAISQNSSNERIAAIGGIAELRGRDNADLMAQFLGAERPGTPRGQEERFLPPHYEDGSDDVPHTGSSAEPPLAREPDTLTVDATLSRIWKANGFDGVLRGAAVCEEGGECVVVVVPDEPVDPDKVRDVLKPALGASRVITLNEVDSLLQLVGDYLEECVPELADAAPRITLDIRGRNVIINLASDTARLQGLVRSIRDPERLILQPLEDLLGATSLNVSVVE